MKLATYRAKDGGPVRIGIVEGETILDTGFSGSMIDLIAQWGTQRKTLQTALSRGSGIPISSVHLLAPILQPGKIWGIGLNYADHIEESKMETPKAQIWFTKARTSINGPYDPILITRDAPFVDYEAELVVIIGKQGKHISAEQASEHVFGYCVGNDVTERMWQHSGPQWSLGKSFDTHAPLGPWITTTEEVADPHSLSISCSVNGETRQSSNTRHLVFDIWQQIAHLSRAMTLDPGDLIFTGTPGGVGAAREPRHFLKEGDVVSCSIDGLGTIEGRMIVEA